MLAIWMAWCLACERDGMPTNIRLPLPSLFATWLIGQPVCPLWSTALILLFVQLSYPWTFYADVPAIPNQQKLIEIVILPLTLTVRVGELRGKGIFQNDCNFMLEGFGFNDWNITEGSFLETFWRKIVGEATDRGGWLRPPRSLPAVFNLFVALSADGLLKIYPQEDF